jgi:bpmI endonuclease-methyltransferase fusion protein type IIG
LFSVISTDQAYLSALAEQMLAAQEQLNSAISDSDKNFLQQRVGILDKQINTVVYKLYGLTEDEVKIVEGEE